MLVLKIRPSRRCRRLNSCSRACMHTNVLAATQSVFSPPEKNSRSPRKSRLNEKMCRFGVEGRITENVVGNSRSRDQCHSLNLGLADDQRRMANDGSYETHTL